MLVKKQHLTCLRLYFYMNFMRNRATLTSSVLDEGKCTGGWIPLELYLVKLWLIVAVSILFCCSKSDAIPSSPNVYVAGLIGRDSGVYWNNGVLTYLQGIQPTSITVSGPDVYVAGYGWTGSSYLPNYSKNGIITNLSDGTHHQGGAQAIAVSGTNVYVAGVLRDSTGVVTAVYWKNGVAKNLTDGTNEAWAHSIAVFGNDVYVAGYDGRVAKYWKNGVAVSLNDGTEVASAFSVMVSGSDVYVAGTIYNAQSNNYSSLYWKNGVATNQSILASSYSSIISSVIVSGSDVYATGVTQNQSAVYWKNGVQTTLSNNGGANDIAVSSSHIYVTGYVVKGYGVEIPVYWNNGVQATLNDLSDPSGGNAFGIFLK